MRLKPSDANIKLRRKFFLRGIYYRVNKLLKIQFEDCEHTNCSNHLLPDGNKQIDLITVAFNNLHVLEHQINLVAQKITDKEVFYLIADNSTDETKAQQIRALCCEKGIAYIRLPKVKQLQKYGSYTHGIALTWLYYNYICPRKPYAFGFLDHDIFPLANMNIEEKIGNQGFYGYRRRLNNLWYIWPGMLFFHYRITASLPINFLPCILGENYLDTGGSMYPLYYSSLEEHELKFASFERLTLATIGYENESTVEFIDQRNWFHSSNGSYWRAVDNYENIIDEIIENAKTNKPQIWS